MRFIWRHVAAFTLLGIFLSGLLIVSACAARSVDNHQATSGHQAMNKTEPPINNSAPPAREAASPAVNNAQGSDDLSFEANIRATGRDQLLIRYTVRNRGSQPMLLINRPPARPGSSTPLPNPNFVYVETQPDGTVEISKRVKELPRETTVFMPDVPGATLLAPGKSFSEDVNVDLAARRRRTEKPITSVPEIPDPVKKVRFCLGVAPAEGLTTKAVGKGKNQVIYPDPGAVLMKQRLLCSETVDLK